MKIKLAILITCFVLSAPNLKATAQIKPSTNSVLPYIIDNPNDNNQMIRVRCLSNRWERQAKRDFIRDRLLQTPSQENFYPNYITIQVEGSCHNVKIRLPNNSYTDYIPIDEPMYGDYWLYRQGSGWNWLKNN